MPLVRISYLKGRPQDFGGQVGEIVYESMRATINVPEDNRFQLIQEHEPHTLVYAPKYMGVERTDGVVFIQVFLNEGRSLEMKQAFYRSVADSLHEKLGVRRGDVQINLVEVKKENWSMGEGRATYVE